MCEEKMPLSVLVIEDNDINRRFLMDLLHLKKHEVYDVISEEAAHELLKNTSIDLVLSDYLLGEGTAEAMLRQIKKEYPAISLCLVSGIGKDKVASLCDELHMTYLEKPIKIDHFFELLKAEEATCQRVSSL